MVRALIIFGMLPLLAIASVASAGVTANCDDDNDGAMLMDAIVGEVLVQNGGGEYEFNVSAVQLDYPAHMNGDFVVDGDPTVWLIMSLTNETDFDWTDYHVTIGMLQEFSFSGAMQPVGWTNVVAGPAGPGEPLPGHEPTGTGWVGTIDYYQGTGAPVLIGETATFGFAVTFDGTVSFCTEQYPTPEPASLGLLTMGGLVLVRRRR